MDLLSRKRKNSSTDPAGFDLDAAALRFNASDYLLWRDLMSGGCIVIGDAGSGKTTGALTALTRAAHRAGCSIVHVCVKPEDGEYWRRVAVECKRNFIDVAFGACRFNPLAWMQACGKGVDAGRLVESLTELVLLPLRREQMASGGGGGGDVFWVMEAKRYLRQVITAFVKAGIPLSFELISETLLNLPMSREEVNDPDWQRRCPAYGALLAADECFQGSSDRAARNDLDRAADFLLRQVALIPEKTRASVVATIVSAISPYLTGVVGETLTGECDKLNPAPVGVPDSEPGAFRPSVVVEEPSVVILDMPLQQWGASGAIVQRFILSAVQDAVLRRASISGARHPVVIVMDECQEFVDPEKDAAFMRTARDRNGCMILATQCTPNLINACSATRDPKAAAQTLLVLPSVKLFGATMDPETLQFIKAVFTEIPKQRYSLSTPGDSGGGAGGSGGAGGQNGPRFFGGRSPGATVSTEMAADVPPMEMVRLKRGGPEHGFSVEMYCAVTGRVWKASGKTSLKVVIPQCPPGMRR